MNNKYLNQNEYVTSLEREVKKLRLILGNILDLYPYLNCVCGRNKSRIPDEMRKQARDITNNGTDRE